MRAKEWDSDLVSVETGQRAVPVHTYPEVKSPGIKEFLKENYSKIFGAIQILADFLAVVLSFRCSYVLWSLAPITQQKNIEVPDFPVICLVGSLYILFLGYSHAYRHHFSIGNVRHMKDLFRGLFLATGGLIILSFFLRHVLLGRSQVFYFLFVLLLVVGIERWLLEKWQLILLRKGIGAKRALIFGAGEIGVRLAKGLLKYPQHGYFPLGFIDDKRKNLERKVGNPIDVLGSSEKLEEIVKKNGIEEVLIAIPSASEQRLQEIMTRCKTLGVKYKFVPKLYDIAIQKVRTEQIDGIPLFSIKSLTYKPFNSAIKRIFDIVFSLGILLFFLPIFPVIAIAIKLDSRGPVLFKQERVGKHGRKFVLYKFRTMYVHTPKYALHPQDSNDPRITRVGRFLRRTSLDEFPQFLNVLKGDMSIVGPRPEMEFIVQQYNELHKERLNVKPGITGLWQLSADRRFPIHENIDHDLFYIENQSFLLDLMIIFETLIFAFRAAR